MPVQRDLNAGLVPGAGSGGQPLFASFGRTANTNLHFMGLDTHYNALQAKLDKRFSGGFQLTTAYTFGKGLGWVNETDGLAYYINPRRSYARTQYDRTHVFVQSYIYELPFGAGKRYLRDGIASWLAGGWQITGIVTVMSGSPLNFTTTTGPLNAPGANSNSPNIAGPVKVLHGIDTANWFDTTNFSAPPPGQFGNLGRFTTDGPGFFNLDASVFRRFSITERWKIEFRAEGYSVTNTPQFSNPNTVFGDANFGKVKTTLAVGNAGSTGGNRSLQLGAKITF
jgi:hypothetical protein